MIIELVGLPGSGKSTYARALASGGRYRVVKVTGRSELIFYNLLFCLQFPVRFVKLFSWCLAYRGPRQLWRIKLVSIFLDYNAKYIKANKYKYAVLDQGHLQTFLSLFETEIDVVARNKLLRLLPKADHYIWFNVSSEVRVVQLNERGQMPRPSMDPDLREKWQQAARSHYSWLQGQFAKLAPATSDEVNETTDLTAWRDRYQKTYFVRYVTFARMPTEKAHGLQIATMCEQINKLGHFVSLVTPRRTNDIEESVTKYYSLTQRLPHYQVNVFDITGFFKYLNKFHHYAHELLFAVGVLVLRSPRGSIVYTRSPLIAKVMKWRGRYVIAEQHFWPETGKSLTAWLLRRVDTLVANSSGTAKAMSEYGLEALVANNGFPAEWLYENISKADARAKIGLNGALPVVMYIGSRGGWKGVDTLAKAQEKLQEKAMVVVIGGSEEELKKWQKKFPQPTFLSALPYAELGWVQKAADILVAPNNPTSTESERYTSPIKLFAHLASGRPLVVSDLPSMRAIVDEKMVWFFKAGDEIALAKTIEQILSEEENVSEKVEASLVYCKQFAWDRRAELIFDHVDRKLLNQKNYV